MQRSRPRFTRPGFGYDLFLATSRRNPLLAVAVRKSPQTICAMRGARRPGALSPATPSDAGQQDAAKADAPDQRACEPLRSGVAVRMQITRRPSASS